MFESDPRVHTVLPLVHEGLLAGIGASERGLFLDQVRLAPGVPPHQEVHGVSQLPDELVLEWF